MVWCGVVWCGVVWCGVVWCGEGLVWGGVGWCVRRTTKILLIRTQKFPVVVKTVFRTTSRSFDDDIL